VQSQALSALHQTYESLFIPSDAFLLVCFSVREAFDLTGLTAEETVQIRSDFVSFAGFEVMALSASSLAMVRCPSYMSKACQGLQQTLKRLAPFLESPVEVSISKDEPRRRFFNGDVAAVQRATGKADIEPQAQFSFVVGRVRNTMH